MPGPSRIRARRQSLLWLLRSLYLARLGLCYFVMTRGRHAAPDLVHASLSTGLFVDLLVFLAAFFEYFPTGRRVVLVDSWLKPVVLATLVGGGLAWTARPAASLGWERGPVPVAFLAAEFIVAPALTLLLVWAIGRPAADRHGGRDLSSAATSSDRGPA